MTIETNRYQEEFTNDTNLTHIYVPSASVDTYKAAAGWITYTGIISAIV